jgi:hypothetical protein
MIQQAISTAGFSCGRRALARALVDAVLPR